MSSKLKVQSSTPAPAAGEELIGLVDEGLALREQIGILEKRLDLIEARLKATGLESPQVELEDPEREGRQWLAYGSALIVPVVFTADLLVKSFKAGTDVQARINAAANGKLGQFFRLERKYERCFETGKRFRSVAAEVLASAAPRFIDACLQRDKAGLPKSDIKVAWGDATNRIERE